MKILQVNTTVNYSAPGKIAEAIGERAIANGFGSYIAYGRGFYGLDKQSTSNLIKIGSRAEVWSHVLTTRLFDRHGKGSSHGTTAFINKIKQLDPDIIHLHNVHGYYLNYSKFFQFLAEFKKPVVWTLHDCWAFTGHCAFYTQSECNKWQQGCKDCVMRRSYPSSLVADRSKKNYESKRHYFNLPDNLTIVSVSDWHAGEIRRSFLRNKQVIVIHNGIDLNTFRIKDTRQRFDGKKVVLGVSNVWEERKGLRDFLALRGILPDDYVIVLVGMSKKQIRNLPDGIIGIERTQNAAELADYYNMADVFVNPSIGDSLPTTNIEALACGTPVVTYDVGGASEVIDEYTGRVVNHGNIAGLYDAIRSLEGLNLADKCRARAVACFDKDVCFEKYIDLYKSLIKK